eukprot:TRINITY_DN12318_c1_g2_i4.p1 TRINITY_DN12318_c1_g2~~TRINITY_DN12318_c1_g2_i4.p1  ORF type:complete len:283 (-),score=32.97 TRINITY_DN12318_c1_g2_i4:267-1115(-)
MTKYILLLLIFVFVRNGVGTLIDPGDLGTISLGIGIDFESIESEIQNFQDIFTSLTQDLTVEEAAENFPEIFNSTAYGILGQTDFVRQFGMAPVYEGVFRSPNGTEIVLEVAKTPELIVDAFFTLISNLDLDALLQANLFDQTITNWGLAFVVPFLQPPFNEHIVDIVVEIVLALINGFPTGVESAKGVMEPLLDTLETPSGDLSGLFQILQGLSLSDIFEDYLADAFEMFSTEFYEPQTAELVANLVGQFVVEFQKQLDLDDPQLLQLIIDIFKQILNNLP